MPAQKITKTILVAPLDWGLGHATRCIPVIRELQRQGCKVIVATSGAHAILLQQAFPAIDILPLKGYGIRYGRGSLMLQLFRQLPRFFKTIRYENQWLKQAIHNWKIDGVISDNRYGLYSSQVPGVFISHQLRVKTPDWLKWMERLTQKKMYGYISRFGECWVPDDADIKTSLASALSHPKHLPAIPVKFVGWLTRFLPQPAIATKKYRLLISLSGPEPQRTLLENILLSEATHLSEPVMLIRGLPGEAKVLSTYSTNIKIVNHLSGAAMQAGIAESSIFLSRCGYSTLMDLQTVSCRCIFIPTPGQTEQEYLGKQIAQSGKAVVLSQQGFNLEKALQQADALPPFSTGIYQNAILPGIIEKWLANLS